MHLRSSKASASADNFHLYITTQTVQFEMRSILGPLAAITIMMPASFAFAQSTTLVTTAQCTLGAGMAYATAKGRDLGIPMSAFMSANRRFQQDSVTNADMRDVDRLTKAVYADVKETPEQVYNTMFQVCMAHSGMAEGR